MARVTWTQCCIFTLLLVGAVPLASTQRGVAEAPLAMTDVSWNPHVNCVPVVTTLEDIIGTNLNPFNGGLLAGNQYATYNLKYFDQNGDGSFQPGEPVVYDISNNGIADVTPGKNDQFYSTSTSENTTDSNLSTSPVSLVSGSLLGQSLKIESRLKYIDGSTTAYYNTTNGSWDEGGQNIGETVVFDANNDGVVDAGDMVVSGGVRAPSVTEIGKPLVTQTFGGILNKRMLNPPCTITNESGQLAGVFVEIRGVYPVVWDYTVEDCASAFNGINGRGNFSTTLCDSSGNMQTFGFQGECAGIIHTACNHRIHFEIDRDWQAKGWCGPGSAYCDNSTLAQYVATGSSGGYTSLDVQGFTYWDPTEVDTPGHMYSGWELHPFTAWRLSTSLKTTIRDSTGNPVTSITAGTSVHDTTIISGGSGVFTGTVTYKIFSGTTCTGTATEIGTPVAVTDRSVPNSAIQTFDTVGNFSWNAVYSDDHNNYGATSLCEPLTITPPIVPIIAFSPTRPASGQKVAFYGTAKGGTPPYVSWSWNFGDGSPASSGASVTHSYSKAGSYSTELTVTDSNGVNSTSVATITIAHQTILGLDPTLFYETVTSVSAVVATAAIGLFWSRTRAHLHPAAQSKNTQ